MPKLPCKADTTRPPALCLLRQTPTTAPRYEAPPTAPRYEAPPTAPRYEAPATIAPRAGRCYRGATARCSIAWVYSRPARYDERTSGPASTPANPIPRASSRSSTNSSGRTHRSTG